MVSSWNGNFNIYEQRIHYFDFCCPHLHLLMKASVKYKSWLVNNIYQSTQIQLLSTVFITFSDDDATKYPRSLGKR